MEFRDVMGSAGQIIEVAGVAIIILGIVLTSTRFLYRWAVKRAILHEYRTYRQNLSRFILLGLEFLVAGDIIRSVASPPNLTGITVLAVLVLIRCFLAMQLEMEIDGRWPWQRKPTQT